MRWLLHVRAIKDTLILWHENGAHRSYIESITLPFKNKWPKQMPHKTATTKRSVHYAGAIWLVKGRESATITKNRYK